MFYGMVRTCRLLLAVLGTITFKSAHPRIRVPPTQKDSDALSMSSSFISSKEANCSLHTWAHLEIENFIDEYCIIIVSGRSPKDARLRLKRVDVWALCVSENKKGALYS